MQRRPVLTAIAATIAVPAFAMTTARRFCSPDSSEGNSPNTKTS